MNKQWVVLVLLVLGTNFACAASFDCDKAGTKVEKMICADPGLSKLDEELGKAYGEAREKSSKPFSVKVYQLRWLKKRDKCTSKECLKEAYLGMTSYLKSEAAPPKEEACRAPKINWGDYEWYLIRGKGESACEDMLSYLESRPKDGPPPVCPEERLPKTENWSRPEARFMTKEERKALVDAMPEKYRYKPGGPTSYEQRFTDAAKIRVIHTDITRDGKPEYLLGLTDYSESCVNATQCDMDKMFYDKFTLDRYGKGPSIHIHKGQVDYYDLFPMTEDGEQVDWNHPSTYHLPLLMNGELVYYKGKPYWLSTARWYQNVADKIDQSLPIIDPARSMFYLTEIGVASKNKASKTPPFSEVTAVTYEHDPESNNVCRFGYFNHKAIEKFQGKGE